MTSAQMLKRIDKAPVQACEPEAVSGQVFDFASSAGFTPYGCIRRNTCPVCGSKGSAEHYEGTDVSEPSDFFYCDRNRGHIFEFDTQKCTADRVSM